MTEQERLNKQSAINCLYGWAKAIADTCKDDMDALISGEPVNLEGTGKLEQPRDRLKRLVEQLPEAYDGYTREVLGQQGV